jgi:sphingomyelin phosphodiesterase acid-like 3
MDWCGVGEKRAFSRFSLLPTAVRNGAPDWIADILVGLWSFGMREIFAMVRLWCMWMVVGFLALVGVGSAQTRAVSSGEVGALMVSDIHLDPFHDPAKAKLLEAAPESGWAAILRAPDAEDQAAAFAAVQAKCHARGVDTPYVLLRSSLDAMQKQAPGTRFITVTGDLIAHAYPCRYKALVAGTDYEAFVTRTITFVTQQLREAFPGVPVYVSLGNNDSGCADYRLDAGGDFLKDTAAAMTAGLPAGARAEAAKEYAVGGYYSSPMEPVKKARVIVLNDIYWSPKYETCAGAEDTAPGTAELAWLGQQLAAARASGERVWVMGHIPPGVNAFSTVKKGTNVCAGGAAEMFLDADALDTLLLQYPDVVRLGLFGHTHMDEMRLITLDDVRAEFISGDPGVYKIPVKVVPSISPVDGNNPSFTMAEVNAATADLKDYRVVVASNQTGVGTVWSEEYDYAQTYREPDFSAASVAALVAGFRADAKAERDTSQAYIQHYFKGDVSRELASSWGQNACSLDELTAKGYAGCVCGGSR